MFSATVLFSKTQNLIISSSASWGTSAWWSTCSYTQVLSPSHSCSHKSPGSPLSALITGKLCSLIKHFYFIRSLPFSTTSLCTKEILYNWKLPTVEYGQLKSPVLFTYYMQKYIHTCICTWIYKMQKYMYKFIQLL